ncbi:DUF3182 family protein [Luteimonas sp. SX5]|uniref:DUF3182 family protein n=1 Tax=Luteimonas galliterrae TaxID=2940486 RepID=A0ABT0MIR1_9GAMM|nr:DUF3182 family protein [Luteimonas galliterrae]MCL1634771.1 DUF3182 family protein [Luteimonas galliterrae]
MDKHSPGARPVVLLVADPDVDRQGHDHLTRIAMAERIAVLHGSVYAGEFDPDSDYGGRPYFVPDCTLLHDDATRIGVRDHDDLFGGVVPYAFLANKIISHPLPAADAAAPRGWSPMLAQRLGGAVLPGFSAFDAGEARHAGRRLLALGQVRIKAALGVGGAGQAVAGDPQALDAALDAIDPDELREHGVVVELDLPESRTYSVGALRLSGMPFAYYGTQLSVQDRDGQEVYGGTELVVLRGGFAELARLPLDGATHAAIECAAGYDRAISEEFPAFFASRRNYDVIAGSDSRGRRHRGVLEQSWRIGGATPAELAAVEALSKDPGLAWVSASTHESHRPETPPPRAQVHFHDPHSRSGPILKYALVRKHGHTA